MKVKANFNIMLDKGKFIKEKIYDAAIIDCTYVVNDDTMKRITMTAAEFNAYFTVVEKDKK